MAYDIFGEVLRRGHCEVHPWVHEEYPCSMCFADKERHEQAQEAQSAAERAYEDEYYRAQYEEYALSDGNLVGLA